MRLVATTTAVDCPLHKLRSIYGLCFACESPPEHSPFSVVRRFGLLLRHHHPLALCVSITAQIHPEVAIVVKSPVIVAH